MVESNLFSILIYKTVGINTSKASRTPLGCHNASSISI